MQDYYEILGVPRDADQEKIKKAYREKAFKYHPDRNAGNSAAEEQFKKISEAYTVLGDESKKSRYDLGEEASPFGSYTAGQGSPYGGFNPFDQEASTGGSYTWRWYGTYGQRTEWTRREAFELLLKSLVTTVAGVLLFRFSLFFGILGIIICISAIGNGLLNSLKAIRLLMRLKR